MSAVSRNNVDIIFENEQLIAVNKPSGLLSIPDRFDAALPSLMQLLSASYGRIFTVHRLDRDTSGLILFAKDEATHKYLSQLFEAHSVEKYYCGIVLGKPSAPAGTIDAPIAEHPVHKGSMVVHRKGREAKTDYEVLEGYSSYSLLRFRIHTGRTHQIRVHAKHIGHPIACDILYGDGKPVLVSSFKKKYKLAKKEEAERPLLSRLALHAHTLKFLMPGGEPISLTAPMPKDMRALLQQLSKK